MAKRRLANALNPFADDPEYFHMIDIVARNYGVLPSEIRRLDWFDLAFCIQCLRTRGERISTALKKNKKSGVQPMISIGDFVDCLK
jgi:hypothetical protein